MTEPEQPKPNPKPRIRPSRFLSPGATGNEHGYKTRPLRPLQPGGDAPEVIARIREATSMIDEPESIGPAILDAYGESARFYESLRHKAEVEQAQKFRRQLTLEQRIADVQRRAKQKHVNLGPEFHAAQRMLDRARQGGRKEPEAVRRRVEACEARLDGIVEDAA